MVVGLVVVRGEECGAAFRNGKVEVIFSEVVLKGGKVCVCVGFHGGDVCVSGYDVDVVGVLGESCLFWLCLVLRPYGIGKERMGYLSQCFKN